MRTRHCHCTPTRRKQGGRARIRRSTDGDQMPPLWGLRPVSLERSGRTRIHSERRGKLDLGTQSSVMGRSPSPVRSDFCLRRYVAGALCALLLLCGSSWPRSAPDAKPLTAILLIARDDLPDSNFADSVVLVMNNLGPAPVGIIINRPMGIPVSRLFPDLKRLAKLRDK